MQLPCGVQKVLFPCSYLLSTDLTLFAPLFPSRLVRPSEEEHYIDVLLRAEDLQSHILFQIDQLWEWVLFLISSN